jgi:cytochrome c oxidase subunit 4
MASSHTPLTNAPGAAGAPDAHGHGAHGGHDDHYHPGFRTYIIVGVILTLITVVEVWAYYLPAFVASRAFVPALLIMSAIKFGTVVLFYMHLKYDHRLFRALFTGPFIIAAFTMVGLMFLFGKFAIRLGLLT